MIMSAAVKENATRLCRIPQLFFSTRCNVAPLRANPQTNLKNPIRAVNKANKQILGILLEEETNPIFKFEKSSYKRVRSAV